MSKAIIIGAGIAGIATAIRLAIKGFEVDVYEASDTAGGKIKEFSQDGYRFDTGPSLFTMPQYVDELFSLANKNPKDYFEYEKLKENCRYFWGDGTSLTAWASQNDFAKEVEQKTTSSAKEVHAFLNKSKEIYNITNHVFLEKSLHKLSTYLSFKTLKSILNLPKIDAFRTMAKANEAFFTDEKMVQYANRFATYNGSNPYAAPATLNVIPHLEQNFGAYFPVKGMYNITESLVRLAEDLGVKFIYNQPIEEILVKNSKISGIKTKEGEVEEADIVVSNMDVYFTYQKLLKKYPQPEKILNQERSSSALIFYWGIKHSFKELGLHNIFFSEDYKKEFDTIFNSKSIDADPTVYINITSKHIPDDAPKGGENWFTMINVPNNVGQDWDQLIEKARKDIIKKLSKALNVDLASLIVCESILDPRKIESTTSSYQGSLYGTSSNNQFAAFLRHANFSSGIKDLYFVGGSVHPGGGIPLSLLSANIVGDLIKIK